MEQCVWITPEDEFPDTKYDRIYTGDETCGNFLASESLPRRINAAASAGKNTGLIIPYLTPVREAQLVRLLDRLAQPTEIVVNDVGAFRIVRHSGHTPVIGRLMARQNTDPAILSFSQNHRSRAVYNGTERALLEHALPAESLAVHLAGSPVFSDEAAALFLSGYSRMTVMLDFLPHGMPKTIPQNYRVLLHMESVFVSALPCLSCSGCPGGEVPLGTTRTNVPIYRKKNTCYYKREEVAGAGSAIPDYVSGLLWQKHNLQ